MLLILQFLLVIFVWAVGFGPLALLPLGVDILVAMTLKSKLANPFFTLMIIDVITAIVLTLMLGLKALDWKKKALNQ